VSTDEREVPSFARRFFDPGRRISRIGGGALGGKAHGLLSALDVLRGDAVRPGAQGLATDVPALAVVATDVFDAFLDQNGLRPLLAEEPADEVVALAFRRASLPAEWLGDLRAIAEETRQPLACRSSSLLEDALGRPFAGVYGTKMVPGNQPGVQGRFRALTDAVKFVYASTYFAAARAYRRAVGERAERERMAVIVQEVVGRRQGSRFYPDISGVARSYSFYAHAPARPEDGVVALALGLGKTIVDGGLCWSFSPAHPLLGPPVASAREMLETTQARFWAVSVGPPPAYDPMAETEFLLDCPLADAESDGTLRLAASTYDPASDRLVAGLSRAGPRVLDFAPLLVHGEPPLVPALRELLAACEASLDAPVEIEFALSLPQGQPGRLGLLQVRPLVVGREAAALSEADLATPGVIAASASALGNGRLLLHDVVYVEPETFDAAANTATAEEIADLNRRLIAEARPYLLIGFGRWGSSDPWLGIPVRWDQIAGARAIVETGRAGFRPEPSQGAHFFHNLSSFGVLYLGVPSDGPWAVDWAWLGMQETVARTRHVRHVRSSRPLTLVADGRSGRGVVLRPEGP
jgi:hypothetical protein